jgi:membrane associated rhomboid family serine protease
MIRKSGFSGKIMLFVDFGSARNRWRRRGTPREGKGEDLLVLPFAFDSRGMIRKTRFSEKSPNAKGGVCRGQSAFIDTPACSGRFIRLSRRARIMDFVAHSFEPRIREPMFNVPPVVIATVLVLVLVHVLRMFVLTDAQDLRLLLTFAFIPARYGADAAATALPGGFAADLWTFFSYAFLHADLMHLGLNLAWLLPFATALARRFGAWRYTLFMLVMSAAGAFAHLVSHWGALEPMIGASAAISGAMAAAMRFVFQQGGPLAAFRSGADEAYRVPAVPLATTLRDPRFLLFLAVWLGLNALFGLGTVSFGTEAGQSIAWQAHLGGFFAGLVLFAAFDPATPRAELDTETTGS